MEFIKLCPNETNDSLPFIPSKITREAWNYRASKCNELAKEIIAVHEKRCKGNLAYQEFYEHLLQDYAKTISILFMVINPGYYTELKNKLDNEIDRLEQRQNVLWELEDNGNDELAKACAQYIRLRDQRRILFGE
jgi:hypothetical protein